MPELPEVEVIRRGLSSLIVGQRVVAVQLRSSKSLRNSPHELQVGVVGARPSAVRRFGKLLVFDLDNLNSLLVHLKMTGQLVYRSSGDFSFGGGHPTDSLIDELPDKSTRLVIELENGNLYFNDQRKFGYVQLVPTGEVEGTSFIKKLGPEPWLNASSSDIQEFISRARRHNRLPVKALLLSQEVVAGIGNIYADESLWLEQLHPSELVMQISDAQLVALFKSAAQVMQVSIDHGGSTSRNYVDALGRRGAYLDFANVYQRTSLPCNRCSTPIVKLRVAGRGTHICPNCQRLK